MTTPKRAPRRCRPEEALQRSIIELADLTWMPLMAPQHRAWGPTIARTKIGLWLIHVPNGGHRSKAEAGAFKAMGVRPGVYDLFFMFPVSYLDSFRSRRGGLWIELKAGKGKPTETQDAFADRAFLIGYSVAVVRSLEEFTMAIANYLDGAGPL